MICRPDIQTLAGDKYFVEVDYNRTMRGHVRRYEICVILCRHRVFYNNILSELFESYYINLLMN
jgi:hypothetical protein